MRNRALLGLLLCLPLVAGALPEGFVYVDELIPDALVDLRYHGSDNFVGRPVDCYHGSRAILSRPAAEALARVQEELRPFGLGILIFDAYRPQCAVDQFVRWANDLEDQSTKARFYPSVEKRDLLKDEYIAAHSGHSRGSTVDMTLISLGENPSPLDMGSEFDFFGPRSWPDFAGISPQQRANRLLLKNVMLKHGFRPYPKEWWHFTLEEEPWPDRYFNFPVD
jgi:D-alanyl-D-alanine dipeptidase